ncbi:MAG: hypothetical protein K2W96_25090, partial [Gemmataceae bacterium]|nr:hypothetical protein [Gemmataceae bacterium]
AALASATLLAGDPPKDKKEEKEKEKKEAPNLLPNGDFEEGKDTPAKWQKVDGLSTFWVDDPGKKRGKVIKFDTDILQSQGYEWWAKIHAGAKAKDAPKKKPTVEPKYDTLAGLDGVWFWSDFIPVEKGKKYWLTMDIKSEGPDVMAWLVGYEKKESEEFGADANAFQEYLMEKKLASAGKVLDRKRNFDSIINKHVYRGQLNVRYSKALPDGWRRMTRDTMPFNPTSKHTPKVKFVRVLVLPYWPPGICYLDNVRLTEVKEGEKK